MLSIGDNAPTFTLPSSSGTEFNLGPDMAHNTVIFFYPKDDTPGCTKEAIGFTQLLEDFATTNTRVVGISKDTLAKHDKFICKHDLGIDLLSDANGTVCEDYGTWGEKKMYGKTFLGIERSTFLVGKDGTIKAIWRKVKVPGHVEEVLQAANGMAK